MTSAPKYNFSTRVYLSEKKNHIKPQINFSNEANNLQTHQCISAIQHQSSASRPRRLYAAGKKSPRKFCSYKAANDNTTPGLSTRHLQMIEDNGLPEKRFLEEQPAPRYEKYPSYKESWDEIICFGAKSVLLNPITLRVIPKYTSSKLMEGEINDGEVGKHYHQEHGSAPNEPYHAEEEKKQAKIVKQETQSIDREEWNRVRMMIPKRRELRGRVLKGEMANEDGEEGKDCEALVTSMMGLLHNESRRDGGREHMAEVEQQQTPYRESKAEQHLAKTNNWMTAHKTAYELFEFALLGSILYIYFIIPLKYA
jgi:hypothetical protein